MSKNDGDEDIWSKNDGDEDICSLFFGMFTVYRVLPLLIASAFPVIALVVATDTHINRVKMEYMANCRCSSGTSLTPYFDPSVNNTRCDVTSNLLSTFIIDELFCVKDCLSNSTCVFAELKYMFQNEGNVIDKRSCAPECTHYTSCDTVECSALVSTHLPGSGDYNTNTPIYQSFQKNLTEISYFSVPA